MYFWAILERFALRGVGGIVTLALAYSAGPAALGVYTLAVTLVTFAQVAGDISWRQVGASSIDEAARPATAAARHAYVTGSLSSVFLIGGWAISNPQTLLPLLPLFLVPAVTAHSVGPAVLLQRGNRFDLIAKAQLHAVLASLVPAVPIFIIAQDIFAPSLQFFLAELGFALLANRSAGRRYPRLRPEVDSSHKPRDFRKLSLGTIAINVLGWAQSQFDRLVVAAIASSAILGQYAMALTVGRTAGDLVIVAITTVARPRLAFAATAVLRQTGRGAVAASAWATTATTSFVALSVVPALRIALGPKWQPAFNALPFILLATIPASIAALSTVVLQARGRPGASIPPILAGTILALPVGFGVTVSVAFAAGLYAAREVVMAIWRVWLAREAIEPRALRKYAEVSLIAIGAVIFADCIRLPLRAMDLAVKAGMGLAIVLIAWRNMRDRTVSGDK